ncbi:hypothetical protein K466DRAFT_363130 [Polyporus arcularius HHB13444]|uniref:Uncharacterized protein n=1 Tax=Polyporus arcularius HHB13444 TaxID=1314778 RepID=A0A5C3PM83_9APHY|nr:hypothetical protein K466DRAFT_363130 [Polyporus arcularius HHB13444]
MARWLLAVPPALRTRWQWHRAWMEACRTATGATREQGDLPPTGYRPCSDARRTEVAGVVDEISQAPKHLSSRAKLRYPKTDEEAERAQGKHGPAWSHAQILSLPSCERPRLAGGMENHKQHMACGTYGLRSDEVGQQGQHTKEVRGVQGPRGIPRIRVYRVWRATKVQRRASGAAVG